MLVLAVYALQRLTRADGTAVPFKLQGRGGILKMQPFQRLIHNGGGFQICHWSHLTVLGAGLLKISCIQACGFIQSVELASQIQKDSSFYWWPC